MLLASVKLTKEIILINKKPYLSVLEASLSKDDENKDLFYLYLKVDEDDASYFSGNYVEMEDMFHKFIGNNIMYLYNIKERYQNPKWYY